MRIGIIAAMEEELLPLVGWFEEETQSQRRPVFLREGSVGNHRVCVVRSDPGKTNAALATQVLIERFAPELLLNVGSSGAISPLLQVGDIAIADSLLQHDFDLRPFGLEKGELVFDLEMEGANGAMTFRRQKVFNTSHSHSDALFRIANDLSAQGALAHVSSSEPKIHRGLLISGDRFISSAEEGAQLLRDFEALAADMEAAAIAQVATLNEVPFVCLRAISDRADHAAHVHFGEFLRVATANYGSILRSFFHSL